MKSADEELSLMLSVSQGMIKSKQGRNTILWPATFFRYRRIRWRPALIHERIRD
jgi:hypothetical protein